MMSRRASWDDWELALGSAGLTALLAVVLLLLSPPFGPPPAGAATTICGDPIASVNFDGGGDGTSWDDPANWDDNGVPDGNDVVCITAAGPVVIDADETIQGVESQGTLRVVSGGSLTMVNNLIESSIETLEQAGGAVGSDSDITVEDFIWTGGSHFTPVPFETDQGITTVTGSLSLPVAAVSLRDLVFRTLRIPNGVTGTFEGGLGLRMSNAILEIQQGGVFNISPATGAGILAPGGGATIINSGTLSRTTGLDQVAIHPALQNNGTVNVFTGRVDLKGGGSSDVDGGNFVLANGTELRFDGGTHTLGQSTITDSANAAVVRFDSGSVSLNATNALDIATVEVNGATLNLGGANTVPVLNQSGGTIDAAGNLSVATLNWSGGTQQAPTNATRTTVTGTGAITGASTKTISARTLRAESGATVTNSGGGALDVVASGVIQTQAGGTFDAAGTGPIGGDDNGAIVNSGTFRKSAAGNTSVDPTISNTGTLSVLAGTLDPDADLVSAGTIIGTGTIAANVTNGGIVAPGASPGTLTIAGDYTQTNAGTVQVEIDGAAPGEFDVLAVTGAASLGGTLAVDSVGFVPAPATTFEFLTHASRNGIFSTISGADLADPNAYVPEYGTTHTDLVVKAPAVAAPTINATDPASPSANGSPAVRGTIGSGDPVSVRIYLDDPSCTAPADAEGTVAQFTGAGIAVNVPADTTTTIRAAAVDAASNQSGCSNAFAYIEDSTPPDTTPPSDVTAPETVITKKPKKRSKKRKVAVQFSSSEAGSTFTCQVNKKSPAACSSGFKAKSKKGKNILRVTATDAAGNADETPAVVRWRFAP